MTAVAQSFATVKQEELESIRGNVADGDGSTGLTGLALSGGGIRSATFSLGVLQALAAARKLASFDYLSTVSGGGYIGSWLSAWVRRTSLANVQEKLGKTGPAPAGSAAAANLQSSEPCE